jgi:uncharacterized protein (DUF1800 family)
VTLGPFEALVASRLTWGRTPTLDAELATLGWEAWLAQQLDPASIDDAAAQGLLSSYQTLAASNQANEALLGATDGRVRLARELSHAAFLRFVHSRRQVYEVLVDFWTNHLNIWLYAKDPCSALKTQDDREVVRAHALGRFADLLSASVHSPAMLVYLDNYRNNARGPTPVNENYGRELLELHTLGIIDGQHVYSEADVVTVARVLSGWTITTTPGVGTVFTFRPDYHDSGPASILGGQWSTPGHAGPAGYQDGVSLIDFLTHHPSTARHLAWKLCRRFVADAPPSALVASAAEVYLGNDTAIGPVIDHIVRSPEFYASGGAKLRRGLDQAVATFRVVGATIDPDPIGWGSTELHAGNGILGRLGQRLFCRDTPDGYQDERADWLSTDGLLRRWELGGRVAQNGFQGITVDVAALYPDPVPSTAGAFLDRLAPRLLGGLAVDPAGFDDVDDGAADATAINWAAAEGLVNGDADGSFRGTKPVKRNQIVTMLWKAAGRPAGSPAHVYRDVPARAPYAAALNWATAQGIVTAYPDGTFRPRQPVLRNQVVSMAWKAAGRPAGSPAATYRDVRPGAPYGPALDWATAEGLVAAYRDGTFRPKTPATRAQVASLFYRRLGRPLVALTDEDRARILPFFGGERAPVNAVFLHDKAPDLVGIILSLPCFQYR